MTFQNVSLSIIGIIVFISFGSEPRIYRHWKTVSNKAGRKKERKRGVREEKRGGENRRGSWRGELRRGAERRDNRTR